MQSWESPPPFEYGQVTSLRTHPVMQTSEIGSMQNISHSTSHSSEKEKNPVVRNLISLFG